MTLPTVPPPPPSSTAEPPVVRHVEIAISYILRVGVILSLSLIILGIAITHVRHPEFRTETMPLEAASKVAPIFPYTTADTLNYMEHFRGRGFVVAGILVLIFIPVASTIASIFAYARLKDRAFVLISVGILLVLLVGFVIGHLQTPTHRGPPPPPTTEP
ncbi:MAG: DUF1634 domain-containing protein [Phycisphaerales bacterium]|nr:DUF1634 domain-containing protein [Phycisphaerales bacterium]